MTDTLPHAPQPDNGDTEQSRKREDDHDDHPIQYTPITLYRDELGELVIIRNEYPFKTFHDDCPDCRRIANTKR